MAPKVSVKNAGGKIWHPPNRNPQRARLYSEMADFKAQPLRNDRSFFLWIVVVCQCIFLEECFCLIKSHFFIPPVFFCPAAFWRHVCLLNVQKPFFRHVISFGFDVNFCLTVFEILHLSVCNQMFCGFWSFARIFWGPFLGREEEEEPLNMAWSIFGTWFLDLIGPRENPVLVWPWKQQKKESIKKSEETSIGVCLRKFFQSHIVARVPWWTLEAPQQANPPRHGSTPPPLVSCLRQICAAMLAHPGTNPSRPSVLQAFPHLTGAACYGWMGFVMTGFMLSKFPEMFDTAFLVARKRDIIFLHWCGAVWSLCRALMRINFDVRMPPSEGPLGCWGGGAGFGPCH